MTIIELLERVRRIEVRTNRLVNDTMVGAYLSHFKGRGMDFEELREDIPGDDGSDHQESFQRGGGAVKKIILTFRALGTIFSLLLLCSCATEHLSRSQLPAEVAINKDAGRGGLLYVNLRLESGGELPFVVDTGSPGTLFDKSLVSKLGGRLPLGTWTVPMDGEKQKSSIYWEPKLYWGNTRLKTGRLCATADFKQLSKQVGHPIMGILAMDCLKHYCIRLDFQAGKMFFLDSKQLDAAKLGKPVPISFSLYSQLFTRHAGLAGGKRVKLLIDTGWDGDGEVEKGAIQGHDSGWMQLPECVWDGEIYTNLTVQTGGNVIGLGFLARNLVTFNFPKQVMYLKQASAGPLVDEESVAALEFLRELKKSGQTPGWSKNDKGTIRLGTHPDHETFGFSAQKPGDSSVFHFTVTRISYDGPWKLQKAWRTDQNGKTIEEYPVP
jgi:predicted aspartyl protease